MQRLGREGRRRHPGLVAAVMLMYCCCAGCDGCHSRQGSKVNDEVERRAELGRQFEVNSELVIRLLGEGQSERYQILRRSGVQDKDEPTMNRMELERMAKNIRRSNALAVVVVPAVGFRQVDSNLVQMLKTNGFSSVRVLAERWGRRFPVPEETGP
jgi:hypothetical protein